ncbi:hypothetical protein ACFVYC_18215 [Pseudarthrobacter sp. NPDC058329]|uniref:hypothetical protein n=1 Tax=Pseudarthrobacter sp. NPDC058329 TaxID=3346448 RepID=UPI0036DDB311
MKTPPLTEGKPMTDSARHSISLTISRRSELEHRLDHAVTKLLESARQANQGILVTRLSPASFTVCLSDDVPYGTTLEDVTW